MDSEPTVEKIACPACHAVALAAEMDSLVTPAGEYRVCPECDLPLPLSRPGDGRSGTSGDADAGVAVPR